MPYLWKPRMVEFPADSYWSRWYCFYVLHDLVFCKSPFLEVICHADLLLLFYGINDGKRTDQDNIKILSRWSEVSTRVWSAWCKSQTNSGFCQLCLLFCPFHKHWLEKSITQDALPPHLRYPPTNVQHHYCPLRQDLGAIFSWANMS